MSWVPLRTALGGLTVVVAAEGCGFAPNTLVDATPTPDTPRDGQALPTTCNAIHAANPSLLSSPYMIDPDGPGGDSPLDVWCDMAIDGGGWTVVFFAASPDLTTTPIAYTAATQRLLDDAQTALIAYRKTTQAVVGSYASFPLPAQWKTESPFDMPGVDVTTNVSVNGGAAASATLRFGYQPFASTCADPWMGGAPIGRVCVAGTSAPFFAGFSSASSDSCGDSLNSAGGMPCMTDRRFSIAVR